MSKSTKCWECWGLNGVHYPSCQSRGYAAVGPHPDAPARAPAPSAPAGVDQEMCCGGTCVRSACDYHRDQGPPAFEYGSFDCAQLAAHRKAQAAHVARYTQHGLSHADVVSRGFPGTSLLDASAWKDTARTGAPVELPLFEFKWSFSKTGDWFVQDARGRYLVPADFAFSDERVNP